MPTKRLIVLGWLFWASHAFAAAPTPITTFCTTAPSECRKGSIGLLAAKGTTDNVEYMVEIDTTTGELPVKLSGSTTVSLAEDHNYGVVGATTLRTAAQIGNATGAASFSTGASSAQTLRVVTATDSTVSAQNFPTTVSTNFGAPGASTIRTAAELGVGGVAVANANPVPISDAGGSVTVDGTVTANQGGAPWTASIVQGGNTAAVSAASALKVDGSAVTQPVSSTTLATEATLATLSGKVADDYGASAGAVRTAAQIGNATGAALFGAGTTTAQVLRVVLPTDQSAIPITDNGGSITVDGTVAATQSGTWTVQPGNTANTTPWLTTINQGGNSATVSAGGALKVDGSAATQPVSGSVTASQGGAPWTVTGTGTAGTAAAGVLSVQGIASMTPLLVNGSGVTQPVSGTVSASNFPATVDVSYGTPGAATVRTAAMMGIGTTAVSIANPVPTSEQGHTYADSARNDYSSVNVTTAAWVQLIAATATAITQLYIDDTCGQVLELGTGAAASETRKLIIPRGGFATAVNLAIPAGTRISLKAITATCSVGDITLTGLL